VVNVYQQIALVIARSSLEHKISLSAAFYRGIVTNLEIRQEALKLIK